MEFKDRLKQLRTEHGLSMSKLAEMIGVSKAAVGNYESGLRIPRQEQLEAIADIFNVDLDYLMCRTNTTLKTSFSENRILYLMKLLNEKGKAEAVKRVNELTFIPEYLKSDSGFDAMIAAHEDKEGTESEKEASISVITDDAEWR